MDKKTNIILINFDIHVNIMFKILIRLINFFYICNKCSNRKTLRIHKTLNLENKNNSQRTPKCCSLCFQKLFSRTIFKSRNQTGPKILFVYYIYIYIICISLNHVYIGN